MAEVRSGYMHKCGKSVKSWKRRWFVLKPNGYLYYHENSSSKVDKGKIDVIDADRVAPWQQVSTAEKKLPSGFSPLNSFAIVTHERTYTCVCENEGDSVAWINAIQKVREGAGSGDQEQQYPPPTFPKEETAAVKKQAPLTSALPPKPLPYTPTEAASSGPPPPTARMPDPLDYGGNLPYQQQLPAQPQGYYTLPKPHAPPQAQAPLPQAPPPQGYHTLPKPQAQQRSAPFTAAPPPGGPGYTGGYPVGNYQPTPAYPPRPPPTQYQQPYQQPYAPQPQYRPPPQTQYRPPPPQPQYSYRPPPAQPQYRPPPIQPQYRPPQQANYRPPYQGYSQPPPPRRVIQQPAQRTTTVTVVTIPAATQYVVRR